MNKMSNLGSINRLSMRALSIVSIIFLCFFIATCDKVAVPLKATSGPAPTLPTTSPDFVNHTTDSTVHKVLLEDYMGHFCTNCPAAVTIAEGVVSGSSGHVISMEVNVGYDADPAGITGAPLVPPGLPDTAYKNDYRNSAGTGWDSALVNTAVEGVPQGMVSRMYVDANYDQDITPGNWGTIADTIYNAPLLASITMVDSGWIKQQIFGTAVTVTLKNTISSGAQYFLQLVLVEDSVLDWQTNSGTPIQYYAHRNVLRSSLNGLWGDQISLTTGVPVTKYYAFTSANFRYNSANITTPPQVPARLWNMAKCSVIAFLYQRTGGTKNDFYILQAQILHLK